MIHDKSANLGHPGSIFGVAAPTALDRYSELLAWILPCGHARGRVAWGRSQGAYLSAPSLAFTWPTFGRRGPRSFTAPSTSTINGAST